MSKRIANKQSQSGFKQGWAAVLLALTVQTALANPLVPSVVNGQASFATAGNTLTVTNTPGAIINWQGFSIGADEVTRFAQQSASSSVLNRVISNNPSSILGALQSNGRVFLVNPNGIVFGQGATVDVAGLVATSLNLSNADFLAGRYNFADVAGARNISNAGNLGAQAGGQIYLIAPNVENSGIINAPNGEILLAAGHSVELVNSIEPNLRVNITAPAGDATNVGQLVASAGSLGLFGTVVRNSGTVSADSATMQGGKIVFKATQRTEISGAVTANGATGGTIQALGNQVGIMDGATVTVDGAQGGGTILIGGDYQGKNPDIPNTQVAYVARTTTISADATQSGNGGKVIVWSDDTTRTYGNIFARGGILSGNGGFVETSGKQYLDVAGIKVSTAAPNGTTGNWLLDPTDITISHSTSAVNAGLTVAGNTSTISDFDINTALSTTNVTISTTSAGTGAGDIKFDASGGAVTISNPSVVARTLQLNAENDIKFLGGATTFASPSSTSVLDVVFNPAGKIITAAGSSVTLDGNIGLTRAWVALARTWENSGTLSLTNNAALHIEHNYGAGASTFHNMSGGIVNVASTQGWAIWSNSCCQDGIFINDGAINVTASTAFEAAYSQSSTGTLNIADTKFLNLQNAIALSGGVNLNASGELNFNENHGTSAALTDLSFSGSGGSLNVTGGKTVNFSNVDAGNVALYVGTPVGGTVNVLNGDAVFNSLSMDGGTLGAMTNGTFQIASGNFVIPSGVTYTGNVGYSALAGNLTVSSPISSSGDIVLTAGGLNSLLTIDQNVQTTTGSVSYVADNLAHNATTTTSGIAGKYIEVKPFTAATNIEFSAAADAAGFLKLSSGELGNFSTPLLKVGNSTMTGNISITQPVAPGTAFSSLSLITGSTISQTPGSTITIAGLNADGWGGVTLDEANNITNLGGHTDAGNFFFTDVDAFNIGLVDVNNGINVSTSGNILLISLNGSITQTGDITTPGGITVTAATDLTMGSTTKAQSGGGWIRYEASTGSVQLGLLDVGAGNNVDVIAGENIADGNGASNNIKAGNATLVASNADSGPGSIDVDTQVPSLYVDNSMVYPTGGQPNNPVTIRNSGSALSVSVYSGIDTGQLTISNNNTIDVNHIGGALNTTLTATGASSDISIAAGVGSLLSAGNIVLDAGRDILITHDYVDAGGTVTATAGRDIRLLSVVLQQGSAPTYIRSASGINLTMLGGGLYIDGDTQNPAYVEAASGNINVVTSAGFANGSISGFGGTLALSAPLGRWLVYASSPAAVTKNGLIPTLYQYNTVYGGTVAPTGNGFIYASPLYVDANFSGTLSNTFGTSPTATSGYVLRGLDSDDAITAITGSASYSNWPITPSTAAASYSLQYASGLSASPFYTLTPGTSQTYTVNPATLFISASLIGTADKTYDGTANATLAPGNFLLSGFVGTDSATVTRTTGTYASPYVGGGILVSTTLTPADYSPVGGTQLSNYILPTSASGNIGNIAPAPLTVTANPANKIYNGQPFSGGNGVSYAGLVNGETSAVLSGVLTYGGTSQGAVNAGSYLITPGGLTSANYDIAFADGLLTINPLAVSLVLAGNKVYDGTATFSTGQLAIGNGLSGDMVSLSAGTAATADKNVGVNKPFVSFSGLALTGASAGNYTLTGVSGTGTITVRPLSIWSGMGSNNLWSNPANWDALPDGNNVLAVSIPAGGSVTFDGAVMLPTLTSAGNMLLNGNNLDVGSYTQTGGSLTGSGNLNVADSFSQAGGTITLTGAATANINQSGGNLNIANLSAPAANLTASTGAITQSGPIIVAALTTQSATGTTLTDIGNQIANFNAGNSASGNIALTNTWAPLTIIGINNNGGDIRVENTGGVITTERTVSASGKIDIIAHSPITIGSGGINAGGAITLTAGAPGSPAPEDIITLNGAISGGSIILAAHSVTGSTPAPAGAVLEIYKEPATPSVIDNMVSNIVLIPSAPEVLAQTPGADATAEDEKKKGDKVAAQDVAAPAAEPAPAVASLPVCK